MNGRIGGVLELLQKNVTVRIGGCDFLGLGDGAGHAFGALGEDELCAIRDEELPAFDAHGLGHGQGERDAPCGGDEGEGDTGIATGGFDDFLAGAEEAFFLGIPDHGGADPAFDGVGGVTAFDFGEDGGAGALGDAVEADEGRAADRLGIVFKPVGHDGMSRGW